MKLWGKMFCSGHALGSLSVKEVIWRDVFESKPIKKTPVIHFVNDSIIVK